MYDTKSYTMIIVKPVSIFVMQYACIYCLEPNRIGVSVFKAGPQSKVNLIISKAVSIIILIFRSAQTAVLASTVEQYYNVNLQCVRTTFMYFYLDVVIAIPSQL